MILSRPVNTSPASDERLILTRNWLGNCLKTHKECSRPTETFMPSRTVKIKCSENGFELKVQKTSAYYYKPYTALSYCWGTDHHVVATRKNLEDFMQGLHYDTLPKAIKDAVNTTHHLGIKHLWVDALCIIQDDRTDKSIELSKMLLIYSDATATIVASRSQGANQSFLNCRPSMVEAESDILAEIPYRLLNGNIGSVVLLPGLRMQSGTSGRQSLVFTRASSISPYY